MTGGTGEAHPACPTCGRPIRADDAVHAKLCARLHNRHREIREAAGIVASLADDLSLQDIRRFLRRMPRGVLPGSNQHVVKLRMPDGSLSVLRREFINVLMAVAWDEHAISGNVLRVTANGGAHVLLEDRTHIAKIRKLIRQRRCDLGTVYLPQDLPAARDASVVEQIVAEQIMRLFEHQLDEGRITASACQLLAHDLKHIAADALERGWPEPKTLAGDDADAGAISA